MLRTFPARVPRLIALAALSVSFSLPITLADEPAKISSDAAPEKAEKIPPPLKFYKGREIADWMHYSGASWLVRESREREEECSTMLKALHLKPGQTVCDMGCGNGFYTLKLAKIVGEKGQVLAVDIQPEMLSLLNERAKEEKLANIKPILGTSVDPNLPEGKI